MKRARGFTLIELIVVIAVIAILATITIVGFSRYQTETADSQRTAKATTITEALEKYYDQHGEYPSCTDLSSATAANVVGAGAPLEGVEQTALVTPQSASATNSISCSAISLSGTDIFSYVGDGSGTCSTAGGSCLSYTLQYKDQTDGKIVSISSRHTTSGTTSGNTTLTLLTPGFTSDSLSWTPVPNASGYQVQMANDAGFTLGAVNTPVGLVTTYSVTGLTPGSTHYYEVRPTFVNSQTGTWSNAPHDTTWVLSAPTTTIGTIGPNSLNYTWTNNVSHADAYTYQLASDSGFGTILDSGSSTGSSNTTSGLAVGTTYYIRTQATAAASPTPSSWSNTVTATTVVPTPTCTASTLNSNSQVTVSWNSVAVADTYALQYTTDSGFGSYSTISGITGTSQAVGGLYNGSTYYFRVQALKGGTASGYGSCPAAATGVDGPTGYGWYADGYGVRNSGTGTWMAYPGAGNYYSEGMTIYGSCSPGATIVTRLYAYYATSGNGSPNGGALMDWTWNNQDRFFVGAKSGWKVWWQGWVSCQSGSNRQGDVYLGNPGPYQ